MNRLEELKERFVTEPSGKLFSAELELLASGRASVVIPAKRGFYPDNDISSGGGVAKLTAKIKEDYLVVDGMVQGGIIATFAEMASFAAATSRFGAGAGFPSPIDLHARFFRPTQAGEEVTVEAAIKNDGPTLPTAEARVFGSDGKLNALTIITYRFENDVGLWTTGARGGAVVTLANFAGVYAAMSAIPAGHTRAVAFHVDFLRPVKIGEALRASAAVRNQDDDFLSTEIDVEGRAENQAIFQAAHALIKYNRPPKK